MRSRGNEIEQLVFWPTYRSKIASATRDFQGAVYSEDSKVDARRKKMSRTFLFPDLDAFYLSSKRQNKRHRCGVSFEIPKVFFDSVRARLECTRRLAIGARAGPLRETIPLRMFR